MEFLNYNIFNKSVRSLINDIYLQIKIGRSFNYLSCINPHSYITSLGDNNFRTSLKSSSWLVPDGAGIVLGAFLLKNKIISRITGYDVFTNLSTKLNEIGTFNIFFLGSTVKNLEMIRTCYNNEFPKLNIVGMYSPPFKSKYSKVDINLIKDLINDSNADVLWNVHGFV